MNIVPLFCEVDDFFLAFEKYQAQRQLPGTRAEKRGYRKPIKSFMELT